MSGAVNESSAEHDDSSEDARLARRVLAGDASAEAELCRRLLPRARAWGLRHMRDEAAANDLAQHVMLTALQALREGRIHEIDRIGAFLFGVCKRALLELRRGERRRTDLLEKYGATFERVIEIPDRGIDRRQLSVCFEHLVPRARAVLALTFFAERSSDEIGTELKISTSNVRVIRHRALEQLHRCMEADA